MELNFDNFNHFQNDYTHMPPFDKKVRKHYFSMMKDYSDCLVKYYGKNISKSCGYCKPNKFKDSMIIDEYESFNEDQLNDANKKNEKEYNPCSTNYSETVSHCKPHLYDYLINHGWRRSGNYHYYPVNNEHCCPQYAIRLKVSNFKMEKKHRVCKRKFAKYLKDLRKEQHLDVQNISDIKNESPIESNQQVNNQNDVFNYLNIFKSLIESTIKYLATHNTLFSELLSQINNDDIYEMIQSSISPSKIQSIDFSSNISQKLVGIGKKFKINMGNPNELAASILSYIENELSTDSYSEFKNNIEFSSQNAWINLKIKDENKNQVKKFIQKISKKKNEQKLSDDEIDEIINKELITTLSLSKFDEEEFNLYKKYQIKMHHQKEAKITKDQYISFLVSSSIDPVIDETFPFGGYGSFHYQYRLRATNELIGVSVIDILPTGWSSVYFFYDPDIKGISLGIYSILHEIELIKKTNQKFSDFQFMYLGFYIRSCPKMQYKGYFKPSELLCTDTFTWIPFEIAVKEIENGNYSRIQPDPNIESINNLNLDSINIKYYSNIFNLNLFLSILEEDSSNTLRDYMLLFSRNHDEAAKEMIVEF